MRNLTAHAYERTGGGELWTELPIAVQDYLTRLVDAAIELHGSEATCANCDDPIETPTCDKCWLARHAETCHDCKAEIPIAKQRCADCVAAIVRTELRIIGVPNDTIERLCQLLDAP